MQFHPEKIKSHGTSEVLNLAFYGNSQNFNAKAFYGPNINF